MKYIRLCQSKDIEHVSKNFPNNVSLFKQIISTHFNRGMVVVIVNCLIDKYFSHSRFKICGNKFCNRGNHCIFFHMKECNIPFGHFGYVKEQTNNPTNVPVVKVVKAAENESSMVIKQE